MNLTGRLTPLVAAGVAVLLSVAVYLPSSGKGHALDDLGDIIENSAVHGIGNAAEILTSPYRGGLPPGRSPYRPITSLSFALSWSMGDGGPRRHGLRVGAGS